MDRQLTDWGYIDWLPSKKNSKKGVLRVGLVAIKPHGHMLAHIHFDEQVIYTFQGTGYSLINGRQINMSASENNLLHWMPGVIHEMYNLGDDYYVHLMVTCSDFLDEDYVQKEDSDRKNTDFKESVQCLYEVLDSIRDNFLKGLRYSFVIYDAFGNVAASSRLFPRYCRRCCGGKIDDHTAPCMKRKHFPNSGSINSFECPAGLKVLSVPIVFQGDEIGYVEGGYVYTGDVSDAGQICISTGGTPGAENSKACVDACSDKMPASLTGDTDHENPDVYQVPLSSLENVWIMLRRLARMISNYCEMHWYHADIEKQESQLSDERRDKELLAADLKKSESSVIDLKINNHFLFNTLNQMAAMALDGGLVSLYQSIVDLSKMFQYTLRQSSAKVTLAQELDYLNAYLKLQKLRYVDALAVDIKVGTDPDKWWVPFNWLVPLVENAFVHGFKNEKLKKLSVMIEEENEWLEIEIRNNGVTPDQSTLRALRIRMRGGEPHGLPMIYQKMRNAYQDQFVMDVRAAEDGFCVMLSLPPDQALNLAEGVVR